MAHRTHSVVAKSAGKVKAVTARLAGLVGVFNTLAEQHAEVKVLLKRLQDKPEHKTELWPDIRRQLLAHERGELREVYPILREHIETRELADRHEDEAAAMEALIDQIDSAAGTHWQDSYDQLVQTVIEHAEQEEKVIFPKAIKAIGDKQAKQLDAKFLAAKRQFEQAV